MSDYKDLFGGEIQNTKGIIRRSRSFGASRAMGSFGSYMGSIAPSANESLHAVRHDQWSRRRGSDLSEKANYIVGLNAIKNYDISDAERRAIASDLLSMFWDVYPNVKTSTDGLSDLSKELHEYLTMLVEDPEYKSVHDDTRFHTLASEAAAVAFLREWIMSHNDGDFEDISQPGGGDEGDKGNDDSGDNGGDQEDEEDGEDEGNGGQGDSDEDIDKQIEMSASVSSAIEKAKEEVEKTIEICRSLGGDHGQDPRKIDTKGMRELIDRASRDKFMMMFLKESGKFRELARQCQNGKLKRGADDVVGIEPGDSLALALPIQFGYLLDETLEYEFLRRYMEKQLTIRDVKAPYKQEEGPICIIVDESGSMDGKPVAMAKCIAAAMYYIAQKQKRWCLLGGYSGSDPPGNWLCVKPGEHQEKEFYEWLIHFYSCGSSRDIPTAELPHIFEQYNCPKGKTDIIQITDGIVYLETSEIEVFNKWKKDNEVKMRSIIVNPSDYGNPSEESLVAAAIENINRFPSIKKVSDEIYYTGNLTTESAGVREAFSI